MNHLNHLVMKTRNANPKHSTLEANRPLFFLVGLSVSLLTIYAAFEINFTQAEIPDFSDDGGFTEELKENGKVFVELKFDATGHLEEVNRLRSCDDLAKREALRGMHTLPDPIRPGTVDGVPATVSMILPVMFTRN